MSAPLASADGAQAALASLWGRHEETIRQRVVVLERAVAALARGALDEQLRGEAEREAHKLAGTLGSFGFTRGSEHSREVELILEVAEALGPGRVPILSQLVAEIRDELGAKPAELRSVAPVRRWEQEPLILIVDDDTDLAGSIDSGCTRRSPRPTA